MKYTLWNSPRKGKSSYCVRDEDGQEIFRGPKTKCHRIVKAQRIAQEQMEQ